MSHELYKQIKLALDKNRHVILSSSVSTISHSNKFRFINDGFNIFLFIQKDSITVNQISYNPYVHLLLDVPARNNIASLSYNGIAKPVVDPSVKKDILSKWKKKYPSQKNRDSDVNTILIQIFPLKINTACKRQGENEEFLEFQENKPGLLKSLINATVTKFRLWAAIIRAPFFTASIAPVILGVAVAYHHQQQLSWKLFLLTLLGTVFAHAGANVINDYYDHRSRNDEVNKYHNVFTGGSRMIQNGIISPEKTFLIASIFFLAAIIIGLYLNFILAGNVILIIGLVGIILGFTYSATPIKLSYRGIGELAIVISYGPLIVLGTYFVQVQQLDWIPVLASIPAGILVGLILFINGFQDMQADGAVGKRTAVVRLKNKKRSLIVYKITLLFVYIWIVTFTVLRIFPVWSFIVLLVTPMIIRSFKLANRNYDKIMELLPVNALTIGLHLLTTLLLAAAFIIDILI